MKNSFVELNARERVNALLDNGRELIDPFDQIIAPSLPAQGIVPESDDGIVVSRGTINGKQAVVIAMEGKFQGGGIGEVSGAKIVAALEHVLEENKKGNEIFPVIVLDTGGVRLQEAKLRTVIYFRNRKCNHCSKTICTSHRFDSRTCRIIWRYVDYFSINELFNRNKKSESRFEWTRSY